MSDGLLLYKWDTGQYEYNEIIKEDAKEAESPANDMVKDFMKR